MKKVVRIVGIVTLVAIVAALAVGAVAYAQDEDGTNFPFDFGQKFKEALADILGISVDEYDAAVEKAQDQVVDEAVTEGWLTDDQAELFRWRMDQMPEGHFGFGMRGMPKSFGFHGRGMFGLGDSLMSIAADKLDMSLTDLLTAMQDGKSIADLAGEKGVDTQVIVDAYVAELKQDLDQAVADGDMTQKQADYALEQATQRVTDQLEATWEDHAPFGMPHGRSGPGMRGSGMRGFPSDLPGQSDA
jgi:polyhydroxyalkanoate synthesis regulator phasin